MITVDAAIERIRTFAEATGWTANRLAVKAGLSRNALRGFERSDWTPSVGTVRAVEALIPETFDGTKESLGDLLTEAA